MSSLLRWAFLASILCLEPEVSSEAIAQEAAPLVALELPTRTKSSESQILARELVRQAFLMTAREQFGARTRDALLREAIPADGAATVFRLDIDQPKVGELTLTLTGVGNTPFPAESAKLTGPADDGHLVMVLSQVNSLTTGLFAKALKAAKLTARGPDPATESAAPPLDPAPFEFTSQVAALRKLHAELLSTPGSTRLLSAVAREYALLGSVTDIHWGIEHKVFKARALLYADRACRAAPRDAEAAWTRGLVWMICGLHRLAETEIRRGIELSQGAVASTKPAWSDELTAFARWEEHRLRELAREDRPLAAYFQMLQAELIGSLDQRMAADKRVIELQPECFRAVASLANEWPLGVRRGVGEAQLRQFALSLPRLLQQVDGFPKEFADELAAQVGKAEAAAERVNLAAHGELLTRLREVDTTGDRGEPSLGVLATLSENLSFVHALQIVTTHRHWLALDPTDEIEQMQEMLGRHPYAEYLGIYQRDRKRSHAVFEKVARSLLELPLSGRVSETARFDSLDPSQTARMTESYRSQRDAIATDLLTLMADTYSDKIKKRQLSTLQRLSPDCPAVTAVEIRLDWGKVASRAPAMVERTESGKILRALAAQFEAQEDSGAGRVLAEKCFVRMTEVDNSFESANALASYYWRHRKFDRWKEVTIRSLALPAYGLEDALACSRLADWLMTRGEWQEAEPYALRSAETYATAGLQSAARCMEGQERWKEAEDFYRAKSRRYFSFWADWYFFCRRTNQGDLEAATAFSRQQISGQPDGEKNRQFLATYYQLEGDLEQALGIHKVYLSDKEEGSYAAMCSILILDELKRTEERDKLTSKLLTEGDGTVYGFLCELIRRPDGPGARPLTDGELDLCYSSSASTQATNTAYFLGRLLLNRGDQKRAVTWLQRAASSPEMHQWTCTLAGAELIRSGIPIETRRKSPWAEDCIALAAEREEILSLWNPRELGEARKRIEKALESHGQSASLILMAANAAQDADDRAGAENFYTRALEIVPGHPHILTLRGKNRERLGRERDAVADYEAALAASPDYRTALNNLTWIRAASNDPSLRDAAAALRLARAAVAMGPDPQGIGPVALAAAQAEAGEFEEAVKLIEGAIKAKQYPDPERLKTFLESYKGKKPYRRPR